MMTNDKSLSYYDRLKKFGLFQLSSTHLRGHELKIYKPRSQLDVRKYFFN